MIKKVIIFEHNKEIDKIDADEFAINSSERVWEDFNQGDITIEEVVEIYNRNCIADGLTHLRAEIEKETGSKL